MPSVFEPVSATSRVTQSGIWCREVTFLRGESYLVEAASGTGKSSLCSFLYGLRNDYSGTILFNGTDTRSFSVRDWCGLRRLSIAYLPQEMGLFPELTAMENIMIKNNLTGEKTEAEITRLMERLGVGECACRRAGRLSVGQQQRVALVRAFCQPFDFILLDEPVSHLDEANNRMVAETVTEEAGRRGAGIIATSVGNHILIDNPIKIEL